MKIEIRLKSESINFQDLYGKGFMVFYNQYKKVKNKSSLYVQFTDYATNDNKAFYEKTDHNDPCGVYGYPLEYVIKHPGDIWYGQKAKYLRVLKANYDYNKHLDLQAIRSMSQALDVINKFYRAFEAYDQYDYAKKYIKREYKETGSMDAKIVVACINNYFEKDGKTIVAKRRTSLEQTKLLLKAGYNTVEDTAKSLKKAAVNDREPEQIIFLRRDAFEIEAVFPINLGNNKNIIAQTEDWDLEYKFAALMFNELGDKLKSYDKDKKLFWSKGGLRIAANIEYNEGSHDDLKLGQKKHRYTTIGNIKHLNFTLFGNHGKLLGSIYDETFDSAIKDYADSYKNMPVDENWIPDSKDIDKQRDDKAKAEYYAELKRKDEEEAISVLDSISNCYNKLAHRFKLPVVEFEKDSYNKLKSLLAMFTSILTDYRNWENQHITGGTKELSEYVEFYDRSHLAKFYKDAVQYDLEFFRLLKQVVLNCKTRPYGKSYETLNVYLKGAANES